MGDHAHELVLIDAACCATDATESCARLLEERFGERAEVRVHRLEGVGFGGVPRRLAARLLAQGAHKVPLLALDGRLMWQGELPNWLELIEALEERLGPVPAGAEER